MGISMTKEREQNAVIEIKNIMKTNLQYLPSEEETVFCSKPLIEINGDPTEDIEV
jgi:hypothetical protein